MQDDTSADTSTIDDDIADLPLFGDNTPVTEAPAETPESTEETAETKGTETTDESKEVTDTEAKDTEATAEDGKSEQTPETTDDKGKPDPALAYKAYQERQRTRQAVEKQLDQVYGPKSEAELYQENLDNGMSEELAQVRAEAQSLREEMNYNNQRTQIAELNAGMQADAVNALSDFPIFNDKSPDYDKDFTDKVQASYQRDARVQLDEYGNILNAEIPLYDYYKEKVDDYNRGLERGRQQAQKDNLDMLSRTESVGGGSQGSKHAETLEEMGERLADMPLI